VVIYLLEGRLRVLVHSWSLLVAYFRRHFNDGRKIKGSGIMRNDSAQWTNASGHQVPLHEAAARLVHEAAS
ncbi:MAG: hypothetical protein CMF59_05305, partial [Leptospiraceae bacterium]|nr:hypothetical protein [Leptospiraceae bacterium]